MSVRVLLGRLGRALPWLILGPFTGPLGWRMGHSMKAKKRILTLLYALAIVTTAAALTLGVSDAVFAMKE